MTHTSDTSVAARRLGVAALTRAAFSGADLSPVADALRAELTGDPARAAALMDLSVIEQLRGNHADGLRLQTAALQQAQAFETAPGGPKTIRCLALAAPVGMGGNTPVEFLIERSPISLTTLYIAPDLPLPQPLPEHDIAIVVAPGDSDGNRRFLTEIDHHLKHWPRPVLNAPAAIMKLERDQCGKALAHVPGLVLPDTARCDRQALEAIGRGEKDMHDILPGARFPVIVRPVGAHAGRNLEKLSSLADIAPYLDSCGDDAFFVSGFIDYRSADGAYRKYRIIFVDGRPYPCHMAIADQWKVWYMNADMEQSAHKRLEEERFMAGFDTGFRRRHEQALTGMARAFGLDYFGIDCAEDRAGNLVMFEADNALIVHDMDSPHIFPYKAPQMRRIFNGFATMIAQRARGRRENAGKRLAG